jgi:Mg-chelatase subunit ChlD
MGTSAIVPGSIAAIAKDTGKSIAESFLNVDLLALVDMSGSMSMPDAPGGLKRHEAARQELAALQQRYPGKIGVIAFSDRAEFVPGGIPPYIGGSTDMVAALRCAYPADGLGIKIVLLSDGEPDDTAATLREARKFKTHIDTVYIGPERETRGRDFLRELAQATGGSHQKTAAPAMLAQPVAALLEAAR